MRRSLAITLTGVLIYIALVVQWTVPVTSLGFEPLRLVALVPLIALPPSAAILGGSTAGLCLDATHDSLAGLEMLLATLMGWGVVMVRARLPLRSPLVMAPVAGLVCLCGSGVSVLLRSQFSGGELTGAGLAFAIQSAGISMLVWLLFHSAWRGLFGSETKPAALRLPAQRIRRHAA